jgi:hypothetical protein
MPYKNIGEVNYCRTELYFPLSIYIEALAMAIPGGY